MPNIPTPLKAALGLAATALDEARKLPETLPQVPVVAITTAMQASLRVQQHIAALAARGDEVISQLRGVPSEPPEWATFDDVPAQPQAAGNGRVAAFDRVEAADDFATGDSPTGDSPTGEPARFEPLEVGGTEPGATAPSTPAKRAKAATKPAGPAKRAKPAKSAKLTGPPKTAGPISPAPSDEPHQPASEPLRRAARRAKATDQPNPVTMAAEIVQAHDTELAGDAGSGQGEAGSEQE